MRWVFHGDERILVEECPELATNDALYTCGVLLVGPGSDLELVMLRMNLTAEDVNWLARLKIAAP